MAETIRLYQGLLADFMDKASVVATTGEKLMLEDAVDIAIERPKVTPPSGFMALVDDPESRRTLPTAGVFQDLGIRACWGEGCNSNCHGVGWAANTIEKLANTPEAPSMPWLHHRPREFAGIGGCEFAIPGKSAGLFRVREIWIVYSMGSRITRAGWGSPATLE